MNGLAEKARLWAAIRRSEAPANATTTPAEAEARPPAATPVAAPTRARARAPEPPYLRPVPPAEIEPEPGLDEILAFLRAARAAPPTAKKASVAAPPKLEPELRAPPPAPPALTAAPKPKARETRETTPTPRSWPRDPGIGTLDVSAIHAACKPFTPTEEAAATRAFVKLETDLWLALLSEDEPATEILSMLAAEIGHLTTRTETEDADPDADAEDGRQGTGVVSRLGGADGVTSLVDELRALASSRRRRQETAFRKMRIGLAWVARSGGAAATYQTHVDRCNRAQIEAQNRIVQASVRLVIQAAHRYATARKSLEVTDLINEGVLGLVKAVRLFDPAEGWRFSTYASHWVKHAIRRAVVNKDSSVRVPDHLVYLRSKVTKYVGKQKAQRGTEPTVDEIAKAVGVKVHVVERSLRDVAVLSLNAPFTEGDTDSDEPIDLLGDDAPSALSLLEDRADVELVARLLRKAGLTTIELDVVRQRSGIGTEGNEPKTLLEIGEQRGLSRERIRQIETKAIDKLREALMREGDS